jgi:chromosome segregation ATPase
MTDAVPSADRAPSVVDLHTAVAVLREAYVEADKRLQEARSTLGKVEAEIQEKTDRLQALGRDIRALEQQQSDARKTVKELRAEIDSLSARRAEEEGRLRVAREAAAALHEQLK